MVNPTEMTLDKVFRQVFGDDYDLPPDTRCLTQIPPQAPYVQARTRKLTEVHTDAVSPDRAPVPIPRARTLSDLRRLPPHRRRFEHGTDFQIGELTVFNGQGASGKTTYMLGTAVAVASGKPILGQRVHKRRPVLIINQEEHVGEIALKLAAILDHYAGDIPAETADYVTVYGAGELGEFVLIKSDERGRDALNQSAFDLLGRLIEQSGAEVVYLDPLSMIAGGGLNDNTLMYPAMQGLKQTAIDNRCAIGVIAHTRKGGTLDNDGAEATLGAAAITNAARIVKGVRRVDAETCRAIGVPYGREKHMRQVVDQKANYTELGDGQFFEIRGVPMANAEPPEYPDGDWVGVPVPFTPRTGGRALPLPGMKDALIQLARGANGGGEPYSPVKQTARAGTASRYYGPDVATALATHLAGAKASHLEGAAKEALATATANGWAEIIDLKIGTNKRKGIQVIWSATPWASDPRPSGSFVR